MKTRLFGASRIFLFAFGLSLSFASNAGLIVTFNDDGFGGVIANFEGSGVTGGVAPSQTAQFFYIGGYTTASGPLFELADPISFAPGIKVLLLGISENLWTSVPAFSPPYIRFF